MKTILRILSKQILLKTMTDKFNSCGIQTDVTPPSCVTFSDVEDNLNEPEINQPIIDEQVFIWFQ